MIQFHDPGDETPTSWDQTLGSKRLTVKGVGADYGRAFDAARVRCPGSKGRVRWVEYDQDTQTYAVWVDQVHDV